MGLPRGRRWVDLPRKPAPNASTKFRELALLALAPATPVNDPLAEREQLRREVEAKVRPQGELRFSATQ